MRKESIMNLKLSSKSENLYRSPQCHLYRIDSMSVIAISLGFSGFGGEEDWGSSGGSGIAPGFGEGFGSEDNWGGGGITPGI